MHFDDHTLRDRISLRAASPEIISEPVADLPEQFVILSVLGTGGMGTVYKCKNKYTDRIVAIKVLHASSLSEMARKRFQQEAKAACALTHENAVAVHDFGISPSGSPYLVMEYLEGETLSTLIKEYGPLPESFALKIIIGACAALEAAHKQGIIHRDIKPSNLVIVNGKDNKPAVKVVDFGIAKVVNAESSQDLTKTGDLFGTPLYMSPEQCSGQPTSARSDIYSLGASLYECLIGVPPNLGDNALQTMYKRLHEPAQPFKNIRPDLKISSASEATVMRALQIEPGNRYQSAAHFRAALEDAAELEPVQKSQPTNIIAKPLAPHSNSTDGKANKAIFAFIAIAVVVLGLLVPTVLFWKQQNPPSIQPQPTATAAAPSDSAKLNNLLTRARSAMERREYAEAKPLLQEALALITRIKNPTPEELLNLNDWLAQTDLATQNYGEAAVEAKQAVELCNDRRQLRKLGLYLQLGRSLACLQEPKEAVAPLTSALKIADELKKKDAQVLARDMLASAYFELGDLTKCKKMSQENMDMTASKTDKEQGYYRGDAYAWMAKANAAESQPDKARQNFETALQIFQSLDTKAGRFGVDQCKAELARLHDRQ